MNEIKAKIAFTKKDKIFLSLASFGLVICIVLLIFVSKWNKKANERYNDAFYHVFRMTIEQGYAEGQAAALKGDVRIIKVNDKTYVWTQPPYGNNKPINDTIHIK